MKKLLIKIRLEKRNFDKAFTIFMFWQRSSHLIILFYFFPTLKAVRKNYYRTAEYKL